MTTRVQTAGPPLPPGGLRWTFKAPTGLGVTQSTFELADDGLRFISDDAFAGSETLPWSSIRQGCTAAMAGMGGRGAPDLPNWVPAQLEWLLLSRSTDRCKPFMRMLPQGDDRDAIVAAIEAQLGPAWIGSRLPMQEARQRLGIVEGTWSTLKVVGIVAAVLALLIILLALLLQPLVLIAAGFVLGGWLCRTGLRGLRDGLAVANTPTARASSAALGLIELEGRAVTDAPTPAAITERACVWWDVTVSLWYEGSDNQGEWRQVAARHGGRLDLVELEDATGRLPVWTPGATLLLETHAWESGKDNLPAPGVALLDTLGFPWGSDRRIRVTEEGLEANQTLYVLGTLDERRNLRDPSEAGLLERVVDSVRSGRWRRDLVTAAPQPLRIVIAVLIGFLDMVTKIGHGGERAPLDSFGPPPPLAPTALVVWKGRHGRPFLVSGRSEQAAMVALRQRSLWTFGIGGAVLCGALYQLIEMLKGG